MIQKVRVLNFPKKDCWDKANIVITVIASIIAVISLCLYIWEITRVPKINIYIDSPMQTFGVVDFDFKEGAYSEPKRVEVFLNNTGNKESRSVKLNMMFSREIDVHLVTLKNWGQASSAKTYELFGFSNNNIIINPMSSEYIGDFIIKIPKRDNEILILFYILEGDFKKVSGFIYYDYENKKYRVEQSYDISKSTELWNEHIVKLNQKYLEK